MIFKSTKIAGAYVVEPEVFTDERGFFARFWCEREFREHGLNSRIAQCSISFNTKKGTLRGMHYQIPPHAEVKTVRCTRGIMYDVIVDLRRGSPTFLQWIGVELNAENRSMLYVPEGCAHGFQTLEDNTEVLYQISEFHSPDHARGARWNDPAFGIRWPLPPQNVSARDRGWKDFLPAHDGFTIEQERK